MSRQSGELPPGWALTELGALSERRGGGTPSRSVKRYFRGNIPWVTVADLPPIGAAPPTILASREAITDEAIAASSAKPIPKDSVVFATRVSVGKVAIAGCTLATNQDFRSLLPGSAHEPAYIAWFLSHIAQFNLPANQGTTIKGITTSKFDGIQVPLPPLAEQRRIVAKIEALQERSRRVWEALSEVGSLLEQFRQSVLAAAFRGDLTADWRAAHPNVEPASELLQRIRAERRRRWGQAELAKYEAKGQKPLKNWEDKYEEPTPVDDTNLPELPDGWCWATIDELTTFVTSGSRGWAKYYSAAGPLFIRAQNLNTDRLMMGDIARVSPPLGREGERTRVARNDLLITITGANVTKAAYVDLHIDEAYVSHHVALARLVEPTLAKYLHLWTISPANGRSQLLADAYGNGKPGLNLDNIRTMVVALPPVTEQVVLLSRLEEILLKADLLSRDVKAVENDLNHLDQAILAKAFRGELVPQDPSDEPASALLERIRAQRKQQAEAPKQTSKSHRTSKSGKKSSRLTPQQLTLAEVLRTAD